MQRVALPCIRIVTLTPGEHCPQHAGVLVGNRNQRLVIPLAIMKLPDPSLQAARMCGVGMQRRLQRTSGSLNQQRAQIDIASQADVSKPRPATGAALARRQAKPGAELSPLRKMLASGTVAASALEVTAPTPSSSLARLATSLLRA